MLMFLLLSHVQPVVLNCKDFNRKYCIIFSFNQQEKCDRNLYCEQLLCHFRPGDTKRGLIKTDSPCDYALIEGVLNLVISLERQILKAQ